MMDEFTRMRYLDGVPAHEVWVKPPPVPQPPRNEAQIRLRRVVLCGTWDLDVLMAGRQAA